MNRRIELTWDSLFLGAIIAIITLHPYFMHGAINFYELGLYLPQINEVFHGKVLYRDMFVMRGPLEILMPWFMMSVLGRHIAVLSAYFYFGTILTLIIYAIFALRIFNTRGFTYLFTLVLIARTFPRVCFNIWGGIRFGFGILAILLAVNFLKRKNATWLFFAGLVSSFAFWTSFEMGILSFISVIAMLCVYGYFEKEGIIKLSKRVFIYAIGAIIASIPFICYLVLNNALAFYADTIKVVLNNMTKVFDPSLCFDTPMNFREFLSAFSPLNHNFKYTLPFFFYLAIGIYLLKTFVKNKITVVDIPIISVFIYGVFLYKSSFRDIEGPQYRMALQPLLLIMFFYIERGYQFIREKEITLKGVKKALVIFLLIAVPLFSIVFSLSKYNKRFFIFTEAKSFVLKKTHAAIPYTDPIPTAIKSERAKGIIVPGSQAEEVDSVIEYISSHAGARALIFTFPDLGTYNFLTDTQPLGRFHTAEFSFMDPEWFNQMFVELKDKKPKFVITARDFSRLEQFRPTIGEYLDKVNGYLNKNYKVVESYSAVNILKIK